MCRSTNRPLDLEVWFRIAHLPQDGEKGDPVAPCRDKPEGQGHRSNRWHLLEIIPIIVPGTSEIRATAPKEYSNDTVQDTKRNPPCPEGSRSGTGRLRCR